MGQIQFTPEKPTSDSKIQFTPEEPEKTQSPFTWANAARMGLSTAGDIAGTAAGAVTGGLGYYPVSALGGAIGEGVGQLMEGRPLDWQIIGVEAALNPLMPGPNIPGKGAGLRELGKFAVGSAKTGAKQGFVGAFPRHQAEQGNLLDPSKWEMPPDKKLVGDTLMGGVAGGVVGTGLGVGKKGWDAFRAPAPSRPGGVGPSNLPDIDLYPGTGYNEVPPGRLGTGDSGDLDLNRPAPYQTPPAKVNLDPNLTQKLYDLGYSQGDINTMSHGDALTTIRKRIRYKGGPNSAFSQAMKSRGTTNTEAPPVDAAGNEIPVQEQGIDIEGVRAAQPTPVIEQPTPAPTQPTVGPPSGMEVQILDKPLSSYNMADLQAEGWHFSGMENGKIRMVRKGREDLSITKPDLPASIEGVSEVAVNPDGDLQWPTTPSPDVVANVEKQGFKYESGTNIFRKVKPEDNVSFSRSEAWETLRRMLGRDPTSEELAKYQANEAKPGEQTGRVAPFVPPSSPIPSIPGADPNTGAAQPPLSPAERGPWGQLPPEVSGPPGETIDMGQWPPGGPFRPPVNQPPSVTQEPRLPYGPMGESHPPPYSGPQLQITPTGGLDVAPLRQPTMFAPDPRWAITTLDMRPRILKEIGEETDFDASEATAKYWADRYLGYGDPNWQDAAATKPMVDAAMQRSTDLLHRNSQVFDQQNTEYAIVPLQGSYVGIVDTSTGRMITHASSQREAEDIIRRMKIMSAIPGVHEPTNQPITQGQQEIPFLNEAGMEEGTPIDADANARIASQAMQRLQSNRPPEPRQLSMEDQMKDAEIQNYLDNEDAEPPESIDLSQYGPDEPRFEKSFEQQWQAAIAEAETLGINWRKHDNVESLNKEIREKHLGTMLTKKLKELHTKEAEGTMELQDWEPRATDPPTIAATRRKLENLLFDQQLTEDMFTQENPPEIVQEIDRITAKLREFDKYGAYGDDFPKAARVEGGGLTASGDIRRAVINITRDYTSPLAGIMNREGMQNAMDAVEKLGLGGEIRVRLSEDAKTIEIHDNGGGLDEEALAEKLVKIFATGKEGEEGATGGKGIGSASYIYGGAHFEIDTISVDKTDGVKYRIIAGGTPEQFLDPVKGSDWDKTQAPEDMPTGTTIKVTLKDDQDIFDAQDMLDRITDNSRNKSSRIIVDQFGHSVPTPVKDLQPDGAFVKERTIGKSADDRLIGDFETVNRNSNVKVMVPNYDASIVRSSLQVHYLNNGMYQFSEDMHLGNPGDGIPEKVLVDIHPLVDDQSDLYPFINTREDIKKDIREEVSKYIKDNVASPGIEKRKNRIQELYDSMSPVPITGTKRKPIIYDPGNRLTSTEMNLLVNSPTIQELIRAYDNLVDGILQSVGKQKWMDRLEGVGIVFDPGMHGVHIPNPATKKSTILFNPFIRIQAGKTPKEVAWDTTITGLHEAAHIGTESGTPIKLSTADMNDPRLGEFLTTYLDQMVKHGDVSLWQSTGHGMDFVHRLGEVFAKYGIQQTHDTATRIQSILTGGQLNRGHSSEIQRILQLYTDSRGRAEVTEDLLSPTGVKQANTGSDGEGNIPGDPTTTGDGTSARVGSMWERWKQKSGWGQGLNKPPSAAELEGIAKDEAPTSFLKEAWQFPTGATTTLDYSAPGRQGMSQILTKDFWIAAGRMFKGGLSPENFDKIDAEVRALPIHKQTWDAKTGAPIPTIASKMGIKMMEPGHRAGPREQGTAGRWLETGNFLGGKNIPFTDKRNPLAASWEHSIGRPIRGSNRAFTTFLNSLRSNRAQRLMDLAKDMSIEALTTGSARPGFFRQKIQGMDAMALDPYFNEQLAREIGDFVNTATGRGPLRIQAPWKGGEISFEAAASKLSAVLFSPRNLFAKIAMLNPSTYIMATPFVRKQYMKAALSSAAAWIAFSQLAKYAGGEDEVTVSNDPTNSDFQKVRIGDTRMDPGSGFQQFLVLLARAAAGGYTSSVSEEFHKFGEGYNPETLLSTGQRFMENKLNPSTKFIYDLIDASEYKPFNVMDRTLQMAVPLMLQDFIGIVKENPDLLPWMVPVVFGWGTQTYDKDENPGRLIPTEYDKVIEGGGPLDWFGLNDEEQ